MMVRSVLLLICCAMTASCQTTAVESAPASNRTAAVNIEWRDRCQQPGSEVFYTVTVSARGGVQYQGLKGVRQRGPRDATVTREQARKILAEARELVADAKSKGLDPDDAGADCLRIRMQNARDDAAVEIVSSAPAARALGASLQKSLRIQDWICPARSDVPEHEFNCGQPVVSYTLTEKQACLQPHVMNVYADGTTHYYVAQSELPDRYGSIDPAQIVALTQLPADTSYEKLVMPGLASRVFYLVGAPAIEYSERLRRVTGFELQPLPPAKSCDYSKEFPVGQLALLP